MQQAFEPGRRAYVVDGVKVAVVVGDGCGSAENVAEMLRILEQACPEAVRDAKAAQGPPGKGN